VNGFGESADVLGEIHTNNVVDALSDNSAENDNHEQTKQIFGLQCVPLFWFGMCEVKSK